MMQYLQSLLIDVGVRNESKYQHSWSILQSSFLSWFSIVFAVCPILIFAWSHSKIANVSQAKWNVGELDCIAKPGNKCMEL